jgi:predicted ATPase
VGKSRLALRSGLQLERGFPDGVWLIELAPLNESGLVPVAVARGLGLGDERAGEPLRELAAHIGERRLLLVLDNCEHLLRACAGLVAALLRACAGLRVLATSREPLRLEGEAVYHVPPLGLPEPGQVEAGRLAASDAVTLFVQRAQASVPGFELAAANRAAVAALCRYLDGIPLAIELAAVRLRALSVEQILERMEAELDLPVRTDHSRPARQQTLRATMDWSHGFLAEPERVLWRRLSVFAGGFELGAAEHVCGDATLPPGDVLDALVGLVERSIVLREEGGGSPRYRLLETVQQYGRERLREVGEDAVLRGRHRDWGAAQARTARARWWGPAQRDVLDRLQAEHDNLRGALASCVQEPGQAAAGLAICADTWFFWNAQRHLREGRRWIETLLGQAPDPIPARAAAQVSLGSLALLLNDAKAAVPALEAALALAEALGDRATAVLATSRLGTHSPVRRWSGPASWAIPRCSPRCSRRPPGSPSGGGTVPARSPSTGSASRSAGRPASAGSGSGPRCRWRSCWPTAATTPGPRT